MAKTITAFKEQAKAMTLGEFKAWLEGFSEAMGSSPNVKQWKKIKERLEMIQENCNHWHYYQWWPNWYVPTWTWGTSTTPNDNVSGDMTISWNSMTAIEVTNLMLDSAKEIGKTEALELN